MQYVYSDELMKSIVPAMPLLFFPCFPCVFSVESSVVSSYKNPCGHTQRRNFTGRTMKDESRFGSFPDFPKKKTWCKKHTPKKNDPPPKKKKTQVNTIVKKNSRKSHIAKKMQVTPQNQLFFPRPISIWQSFRLWDLHLALLLGLTLALRNIYPQGGPPTSYKWSDMGPL